MTTNDTTPPPAGGPEDGTTPGPAPSPTPHADDTSRGRPFFDRLRASGFVRAENRWIGGVASGLARRWGIDPLLARALCFVVIFLTGVGFIAYAAAWALLPEEKDGRIHLEELLRGRFDPAIIGIALFTLVGLPTDNHWWGLSAFDAGPFWHVTRALGVVAVVVTFVVLLVRRSHSQPHRGAGPAGGAAGGTTASPGGPADGAPQGAPTAPAAQQAWATDGSWTDAQRAADQQRAQQESAAQQAWTQQWYAQHAAQQQAWTQQRYQQHAQPSRPDGTPTAPPAAPDKRLLVRGPGGATFAVVVGLAMLAVAAVLVSYRQGAFDGALAVGITGTVALVAGVGVVVSGLRGRRSGGLGALAVVALVVAAPAFAWSATGGLSGASRAAFTTTSWTPTTAEQAEDGFATGASNITIDLRSVPTTHGTTIEVPVRSLASDVTIIVPDSLPVNAELRLTGTDLSWDIDPTTTNDDLGGYLTLASQEVLDGAEPLVHLDVRGAASNITIEEKP